MFELFYDFLTPCGFNSAPKNRQPNVSNKPRSSARNNWFLSLSLSLSLFSFYFIFIILFCLTLSPSLPLFYDPRISPQEAARLLKRLVPEEPTHVKLQKQFDSQCTIRFAVVVTLFTPITTLKAWEPTQILPLTLLFAPIFSLSNIPDIISKLSIIINDKD